MSLLTELRTYTNRPGKTFDGAKTDTLFAEDMNAIREAIQEGSKGIKTESLQLGSAGDVSLERNAGELLFKTDFTPSDNREAWKFLDGNGQVRMEITGQGLTRWLVHSTVAEVGQIAYGTPAGIPGISISTGSPGSYGSRIDLANRFGTLDINSGIYFTGNGNIGDSSTRNPTNLYLNGKYKRGIQSETVADSGDANPGTLTLEPTSDYIEITNNDADGADITMSETNAVRGHRVTIVVVANAGGTVNFADTTGVTELAGAANLGLWDSIELMYIGDRWVELSRSNN